MFEVRKLAVVLLIVAGCSKPPPIPPPSAPVKATQKQSAPIVYVYYTAEEKVPDRFVIAVRQNEVLVQIPETHSDGSKVSKRYLRKDILDDVKKLLQEWENKGQTESSMINGGQIVSNGPLAMTRHVLDYGPSRGHSWSGFIEDDDERTFLDKVRSAMVASEFEVRDLPKWIEDDDRAANDFVGTGAPP